MKAIKDSVHDHIEVDGVARDLLDTPVVQRLRHIKQLSTVRLVYPSANHTRFEHSLGVYHLARQALSHLGIDGQRAKEVEAAALLHDVGHGPYGHQTEDVIERHTGRHHDEIDDLLSTGELADVLEAHDLDPRTIADLVDGQGGLGQLVSGELDVDRMDYLVRDAHHTGVPYGTIDHGRLVRELDYADGKLVLAEGNVQVAESLLLARALMNATVYGHHVSRIAGAMIKRASERLLAVSDLSVESFRRFADHDLLVELGRNEATSELARRLANRDLYKRAIWVEMADAPADFVGADAETSRRWTTEIADDAGVDAETVLFDSPAEPGLRESSTRVVVNGEVRRLDGQSTLVSALRRAQRDQWRLGVYAPEAHVEAVGDAAERVLGLDGDRINERPDEPSTDR